MSTSNFAYAEKEWSDRRRHECSVMGPATLDTGAWAGRKAGPRDHFEIWCTRTSRQEVLDSLASSYRDGKAQTKYEMRRRHELTVFLANE